MEQNTPLPTFEEQPTFEQSAVPQSDITQNVDDAFGKSLATAIMSIFPVASIIAIFFGKKARQMNNELAELAAQYGIPLGGKAKAARILANVGFFAGIGFTVYYCIWVCWVAFIFLFQFVFSALFASLGVLQMLL